MNPNFLNVIGYNQKYFENGKVVKKEKSQSKTEFPDIHENPKLTYQADGMSLEEIYEISTGKVSVIRTDAVTKQAKKAEIMAYQKTIWQRHIYLN